MDNSLLKNDLQEEVCRLESEINEFKITEEARKHEKVSLLKKYNDTKDYAQIILGSIAELERISISALYVELGLNFES